jgi:nucleoside-diphosphate-sugar epimerase
MRILLTGASSFTGYWFATALVKAGHHVTATFRRAPESYTGVRSCRLAALAPRIEPVWSIEFGDNRFIGLVRSSAWDILCHHAAETTNYRSDDFDALAACRGNTRNVREVLALLSQRGCARIIVTGSVFEPFEGVGDLEQRAFSPYGLSKHFSFEIFRFEARRLGLALDKFVIANPFGPLEESRFTSYLAREWSAGRTPSVVTPIYVRDNIHVDLLAREYLALCETPPTEDGVVRKVTPSGYIESQGAFALRVATEMSRRIGRRLEVVLSRQQTFPEPLIRVNCTPSQIRHPEWSEDQAWEGLYQYYVDSFDLA